MAGVEIESDVVSLAIAEMIESLQRAQAYVRYAVWAAEQAKVSRESWWRVEGLAGFTEYAIRQLLRAWPE